MWNPSYSQGFARCAGESEAPGLWRGLQGAWSPALGQTGNKVHDASGNGRDANFASGLLPATAWVPSIHPRFAGPSIEQDGAGEWLLVPDPGGVFSPGDGDFSVAAWMRYTNTSARAVIGKVGTNSFYMGSFSTSFRLQVKTTTGTHNLNTSTSTTQDVWYHVVAVRRGDVSEIYLDGKLDNTGTVTGTCDAGGDMGIGVQPPSFNVFSGKYNHILYYTRSLSPNQVRRLFNDPVGMFRLKRRSIFVAAAASTVINRTYPRGAWRGANRGAA